MSRQRGATKGQQMSTAILPESASVSLTSGKAGLVRLIGLLGIIGGIVMLLVGGLVWLKGMKYLDDDTRRATEAESVH